MKREEAEQVWSMISAVYGLHPERSGEQAAVWIPALEGMDAEIVMHIVSGFMKGRGPEKLPTLVSFAEGVASLERRAKVDEREAPVEVEGRPKPLWYVAWEKRFKAGDHRVFAEQEGAYREAGEPWPPLYKGVQVEIIVGEEREQLLAEAAKVEQNVMPHLEWPEPECPLCEDDGVVQAGWTYIASLQGGVRKMSRGAEQVVPCPRCPKGKRVEHPLEGTGPWGHDGFWRGQDYEVVRRGVLELR